MKLVIKNIACLAIIWLAFLTLESSKSYVQLEKGGHYMVVMNPAKYINDDHTYSIVVLLKRNETGQWKKLGHQLLPAKWDTQGVAIIGNKLFITNHLNKYAAGVMAFDVNRFFETNPRHIVTATTVQEIHDIYRPLSLSVSGKKLYVTSLGKNNGSNGIHIYDVDTLSAGNQTPETTVDYNSLGMQGYSPAKAKPFRNYLIVSNHYKGELAVLDISQSPPVIKTTLTGAANRLYYPLGLAIKDNLLYVSDHIHSFITVFDISDIDNIKVAGSLGGQNSSLESPYQLAIDGDELYVANLLPPQSITSYDISARGNVVPKSIIPNSKDTMINAPSDLKIFQYQ